jgi:hypothetical protein
MKSSYQLLNYISITQLFCHSVPSTVFILQTQSQSSELLRNSTLSFLTDDRRVLNEWNIKVIKWNKQNLSRRMHIRGKGIIWITRAMQMFDFPYQCCAIAVIWKKYLLTASLKMRQKWAHIWNYHLSHSNSDW